jgi:hypothetical protein
MYPSHKFRDPRYHLVAKAMQVCAGRGIVPDLVAVTECLFDAGVLERAGGAEFVAGIVS